MTDVHGAGGSPAQPVATDDDAPGVAALLDATEQSMRHLMRELGVARAQLKQAEDTARAEQRKLILELLSVIDALVGALAAVDEHPEELTPRTRRWLGRFRTVRSVLEDLVAQTGAAPMACAAGDDFDPARHTVADVVDDPGRPPGTVHSVVSPGYVWRDRVLRKTEVVVVRDGGAPRDGVDDGAVDERAARAGAHDTREGDNDG